MVTVSFQLGFIYLKFNMQLINIVSYWTANIFDILKY